MNYKHSCVVDADSFYKTLVLVALEPDEDGEIKEQIQYYTLADGERLVDTQTPGGMVKARWTGTAWEETATQEEIEAADPMTLEDVRASALLALSRACNAAIVEGCDVTLADGSTEHFALAETDQINLTSAVAAVEQGATGYPYHADGQLCKLYSPVDILGITQAATAHKLYHTTYCNHAMTWARRVESKAELRGITYGAQLPADLAANMEEVLTGAAQRGV